MMFSPILHGPIFFKNAEFNQSEVCKTLTLTCKTLKMNPPGYFKAFFPFPETLMLEKIWFI